MQAAAHPGSGVGRPQRHRAAQEHPPSTQPNSPARALAGVGAGGAVVWVERAHRADLAAAAAAAVAKAADGAELALALAVRALVAAAGALGALRGARHWGEGAWQGGGAGLAGGRRRCSDAGGRRQGSRYLERGGVVVRGVASMLRSLRSPPLPPCLRPPSAAGTPSPGSHTLHCPAASPDAVPAGHSWQTSDVVLQARGAHGRRCLRKQRTPCVRAPRHRQPLQSAPGPTAHPPTCLGVAPVSPHPHSTPCLPPSPLPPAPRAPVPERPRLAGVAEV